MKRILYIWQAGYPWDVRVEKICNTLRDEGCEVTILARWKPGQLQQETLHNITIVRVGYQLPSIASLPISHNPVWQKAINTTVDRIRPHMIIPREILLAEAAAKSAKKYSIPVIMDMAEHYPAAMREWKKYTATALGRLLVQTIKVPDILEKRSVHLMDGIMTVCQENSDRLLREYGYPFMNTQVVNNTPSLYMSQIEHKRTLSSPRHFAHHGYITAERGLDTLVQGIALLLPSYPLLQLTLAGEGETLQALQQLVRTLSLSAHVHTPGGYKHENVQQMYQQTDVGVLPYWDTEFRNHTIPNKLFDYMAFGIPVIVSKAQPMKRIVEETGAGIAADCSTPQGIATGIEVMLQQDMAAMSKNGIKAFQEKYNWENDTKTLLQFLQNYT